MGLINWHENIITVGCDEAGRGCLAGPVTAAAMILPADYTHSVLDDSKKLTEKKRYALREELEKEALAWAVAHVWPEEIDEINILNASFTAMHRAIDQLSVKAEKILVDGNRFNPYKDLPHECIIKGDGKYYNIAGASILAKTYRDDIMAKLHEEAPEYNWIKNKGYPTAEHRAAIAKVGVSDHHRKSFQLLPSQLTLF